MKINLATNIAKTATIPGFTKDTAATTRAMSVELTFMPASLLGNSKESRHLCDNKREGTRKNHCPSNGMD
jgi:hypothetical protein